MELRENKMPTNQHNTQKPLRENGGFHVEGHIKIFDPTSGEVYRDQRNAIHYENMSVALAESLANQTDSTGARRGMIYQMAFGNGGTTVDPTGLITYLTPNTIGVNSSLYSQTYAKIVDQNDAENLDPVRNKMEIRHLSGATYTDILISCLLDYSEPDGQEAFDNSVDLSGNFVFDEIGLISNAGGTPGKLLTHVIFHPVQKSLNRLLQIDYTIRIQSLTSFTDTGAV